MSDVKPCWECDSCRKTSGKGCVQNICHTTDTSECQRCKTSNLCL